ncbi:MAG TPA: YigZ family protein [Ignavibacteria bacterium]|nr:YigZ family protein [Ignavibacteria bacterium]HMR40214.1 YigZ family protein [Ignavibacteria bacterium]
MIDSFRTIKSSTFSEIKITRSKFISQAFPVSSHQEISDKIKEVKKEYYDASHHPYAYRLGIDKNEFKFSDDGEPSGSSGKPILESIDKLELTDVMVIVTRYFGGTKLGVGGLRRAMSEAADLCLSKAILLEKLITEEMNIEFDYTFMNVVMNLIESEKIKLSGNTSVEKCKLTLEVRLSKIEKLKTDLVSLTNGGIKIISKF